MRPSSISFACRFFPMTRSIVRALTIPRTFALATPMFTSRRQSHMKSQGILAVPVDSLCSGWQSWPYQPGQSWTFFATLACCGSLVVQPCLHTLPHQPSQWSSSGPPHLGRHLCPCGSLLGLPRSPHCAAWQRLCASHALWGWRFAARSSASTA